MLESGADEQDDAHRWFAVASCQEVPQRRLGCGGRQQGGFGQCTIGRRMTNRNLAELAIARQG